MFQKRLLLLHGQSPIALCWMTHFRSLSDTLEMSTILFCEVVTHRNTLKHQNRIHHKRVLGCYSDHVGNRLII